MATTSAAELCIEKFRHWRSCTPPTGQRIVFRGCYDPLKLKSTKFAKGYCGAIWFEELDQHGSMEDVRSVLSSLRRGGSRFWIFYSFNPPKTAMSWVNKEALARRQRDDLSPCHMKRAGGNSTGSF